MRLPRFARNDRKLPLLMKEGTEGWLIFSVVNLNPESHETDNSPLKRGVDLIIEDYLRRGV